MRYETVAERMARHDRYAKRLFVGATTTLAALILPQLLALLLK